LKHPLCIGIQNIRTKRNRLILSAYLVVLSCVMSAQGGFNLRWAIEQQTGFESVYALDDSTFIVTGWSLDSLSNSNVNFTLSHIESNGNVANDRSFDSINSVSAGDCDSESRISNLFVQAKQTFVDDDLAFQLIWFKSNLDTLYSRVVFSPYLDSAFVSNNFLKPTFTIIDQDSCTFLAAGIANTGATANDFCIKKFSRSGDEVWTHIQSTEADPDGCYALLPMEDGGVIAAVFEGSTEEEPSKNKLIRLDGNGNPTWTLSSPGGYDSKFINCIIGDGPDVVISGRHFTPNTSGNGSKGVVLKLDTLGSIHWVTTYQDFHPMRVKDFTNVVQTCDGNYVAGGSWTSSPGSEEILPGQNDVDLDQFAFIIKLDNSTGAILWERKYRFLEIYRDQHTLVDMKATLDGGVIFCGEARDSYQILEGPIQQGWLVKLDECGCLVPGCDTLCNYVGCSVADSTFFPVVPSHFIVGPNPAAQFINIYFAGGDLDLTQTHFDMYDLQGRLVYSFAPDARDTTYMLSTDQFASGTYVLLLHHNGEKVQEQKIVVVGS